MSVADDTPAADAGLKAGDERPGKIEKDGVQDQEADDGVLVPIRGMPKEVTSDC